MRLTFQQLPQQGYQFPVVLLMTAAKLNHELYSATAIFSAAAKTEAYV